VEQAHACFGQPDIFGLVNAADDRALSNLINSPKFSARK